MIFTYPTPPQTPSPPIPSSHNTPPPPIPPYKKDQHQDESEYFPPIPSSHNTPPPVMKYNSNNKSSRPSTSKYANPTSYKYSSPPPSQSLDNTPPPAMKYNNNQSYKPAPPRSPQYSIRRPTRDPFYSKNPWKKRRNERFETILSRADPACNHCNGTGIYKRFTCSRCRGGQSFMPGLCWKCEGLHIVIVKCRCTGLRNPPAT